MRDFLNRNDPAFLEALQILDDARLRVAQDLTYTHVKSFQAAHFLTRASLYLHNPERHAIPKRGHWSKRSPKFNLRNR